MKTAILIISLIILFPNYLAQNNSSKQAITVQTVMEEHRAMLKLNLWPGFRLDSIPVAVYDSINTYLFFSDDSLDSFKPVADSPGIFSYKGQHPLVTGNSIVRISGKWVATSVLAGYSRRTNEKYSPKDLAGIIVHEQFHIFQRTMHPSWRQNDGVLLFYPPETTESLFLRRIEKELFRKAVTSESISDMAGWSELGLKYRNERLNKLESFYSSYEKQLQRTEGLSDFIEKKARDIEPLSSSNITNGIAPAGVRDLGYVEGRWISMILDKLDYNWKALLQSTDSLFPEDILSTVVNRVPHKMKSFTSDEIRNFKEESEIVFYKWQLNLAEELKNYTNRSGYSLEINSQQNPLNIRMFEPLEIENLPDRTVFNRVFFSATSQKGSMRIINHPCITHFDTSFRLVKTELFGINKEPVIHYENKKFILRINNIDIEFNYSVIEKKDNKYVITV